MKLRRCHIAPRVDAAKLHAVLGNARNARPFRRIRIVAVHKVKMAVLRNARPQRMFRPKTHRVPTHMRHFQTPRQTAHPPRNQPQASDIRIPLVRRLQQQLQPQADAQKRPSAGDIIQQRLRQPARLQRRHRRRPRTHAGQNHPVGIRQLRRIRGYARRYPRFRHGARHAPQIARFVVNHHNVGPADADAGPIRICGSHHRIGRHHGV